MLDTLTLLQMNSLQFCVPRILNKIWFLHIFIGAFSICRNTIPVYTQSLLERSVGLLVCTISCMEGNNTSLLKTPRIKGEIARNEQFLLFPQCFLPLSRTFRLFHQTLNCLANSNGKKKVPKHIHLAIFFFFS